MVPSISSSPVVWQPETIQEALSVKEKLGHESCFVAGGTYLQLQWIQNRVMPRDLISLEKLNDLKKVKKRLRGQETFLEIGSLVRLVDLQAGLSDFSETKLLLEALPQIASPAIRNRATLGGNVMSKKGELLPALLVLEAELLIQTPSGSKHLTLHNWLDQANRQEPFVLTHLYLPDMTMEKMEAGVTTAFFKKTARREAFVPSQVIVSGRCTVNVNHCVSHIRLAVGGTDHLPERLLQTEDLLLGRPLNEETLSKVYSSIWQSLHPLESPFTSPQYLKKVVANLIIGQLYELAFKLK
ncbi:FAD binding domain-containing protein [Pullulanibacillus sp. KACC 23026]|uniref:FAD binding domain-containing protein n=1 Tax=Pullulanibacillus sp. KACC 23026 TaxID=3028315 RepID=UPI0023AEBE90|nr:FAD binding domain-containing protein [Pullulanibacillus sp. KACC 23026]WEG14807.1 FAD binding domain-containing protein [Pullulanibacillus sp. KACC 23026]